MVQERKPHYHRTGIGPTGPSIEREEGTHYHEIPNIVIDRDRVALGVGKIALVEEFPMQESHGHRTPVGPSSAAFVL